MKKYVFFLLASFALFGCEDKTHTQVETIEIPQPTIQVVSSPETIVKVFHVDDNSYSMSDVNENYLSCLIQNGVDEDDYCEEVCAYRYDYFSCDIVEDYYEDRLGIGSDHVVSPIVYRTQYRQNPQPIIYKSANPNYTVKNGKLIDKKGVIVPTTVKKVDTKKIASKYSSSLIKPTTKDPKKVDTKTIDANPNNSTVKSSTNSRFSSSLIKSSTDTSKEKHKEEAKVNTEGIALTATAVAATTAIVSSTASKKSSSLIKSTPKVKPVTVTKTSSWVKSGSVYSCGSFSPSTSSKTKGTSFTQRATCKQKEVQTISYSDKTTKKNTRNTSVTKTKTAYGTKAKPKAYKSRSSSYKKKK